MDAFDATPVVLCVSSNVPCETVFPYPCTDLLQRRIVSIDDSIRDEIDGGCILCIPPDSTWINTSSSACPECRCGEAGQVDCIEPPVIGLSIFADVTTAPCPPSQYSDWSSIDAVKVTTSESDCPTFAQIAETLNCPEAFLENREESTVSIVSSTATMRWPSNRPTRTPSLQPAVVRSEPMSSNEEDHAPVKSAASFHRCFLGLLLYAWCIMLFFETER